MRRRRIGALGLAVAVAIVGCADKQEARPLTSARSEAAESNAEPAESDAQSEPAESNAKPTGPHTREDAMARCAEFAQPHARAGATLTAAMPARQAGTKNFVVTCTFTSHDEATANDPELAPIECPDAGIAAMIPWVGPLEVFRIEADNTVTQTQPREDVGTPCVGD